MNRDRRRHWEICREKLFPCYLVVPVGDYAGGLKVLLSRFPDWASFRRPLAEHQTSFKNDILISFLYVVIKIAMHIQWYAYCLI